MTSVAVVFIWDAPKMSEPAAAPKTAAPKAAEALTTGDKRAADISPEEAATRAAMSSFYAAQLEQDRKRQRVPSSAAIGPVAPDGEEAEKIDTGVGKVFKMEDLDGTAQWRIRMAGATDMRFGDVERGKHGKGKDGKDGKGKGKGK